MKPYSRKITLLASGSATSIVPAEWRQESGAKEFDERTTEILRVFHHHSGQKFMVYGMKAAGGNKTAEAYEIVPAEDLLAGAIDAVAKHCGVESLRGCVTP